MRFPLENHYCLAAYVNKFNISVKPFLIESDNTFIYLNGIRQTTKNSSLYPDKFGFNVSLKEKGKNADQLWEDAIVPVRQLEKEQKMEGVIEKYGNYSIHQ